MVRFKSEGQFLTAIIRHKFILSKKSTKSKNSYLIEKFLLRVKLALLNDLGRKILYFITNLTRLTQFDPAHFPCVYVSFQRLKLHEDRNESEKGLKTSKRLPLTALLTACKDHGSFRHLRKLYIAFNDVPFGPSQRTRLR